MILRFLIGFCSQIETFKPAIIVIISSIILILTYEINNFLVNIPIEVVYYYLI
jgi:hypothetical protein